MTRFLYPVAILGLLAVIVGAADILIDKGRQDQLEHQARDDAKVSSKVKEAVDETKVDVDDPCAVLRELWELAGGRAAPGGYAEGSECGPL